MQRARGFNLIEVVVALGLFSFALVAILVLLPVGLNLNRESQDETFTVDALSALAGDRLATPLALPSKSYRLPALSGTNGVSTVLYLNDRYAVTNRAAALYRVDATFTAPASGSLSPWLMHCRISWPAAAPLPRGSLETLTALPQVAPLIP
ncbi:MAG TPA: hypothetical protein VIM58_13240 [Candidatus Methylacidiphilales bacterium]